MRCLPLRLLAVFLLLLNVPAQAIPVASIQWGDCSSPPGTDRSNRYDPNSTSDLASITVQGLSGTVRGVSFTLHLWAGGSQVPDAWRYDANGCASFNVSLPSLCPTVTGGQRLEATRIDYVAWGTGLWSKGYETIQYEAGFAPFIANPSTKYTIALLHFDHSGAEGACGCLERPLCIGLAIPRYLDSAGMEQSIYPYVEGIHWNDPGNSLACPTGPDLCSPECVWEADTLCAAVTPAIQRSWGDLKASYR